MIKMTDLVTEEAWSTKPIDDLLTHPFLPVSYTIGKNALKVVKGKAVHVASSNDFRNLVKLQNTKKLVSAVTWWAHDKWGNSDFLQYGVVSGASTVSILEGDIVLRFRYDAVTSTEEGSGRKWINLEKPIFGALNADGGSIINDIDKIKNNIQIKYLKQYPELKEYEGYTNVFLKYYRDISRKLGKSEFNKIKSKVIKDMIDELTKYEKKNYKAISKLFDKQRGTWNEVLITNFKIAKCYVNDHGDYMNLRNEYMNSKIEFISRSGSGLRDISKLGKQVKKDITR